MQGPGGIDAMIPGPSQPPALPSRRGGFIPPPGNPYGQDGMNKTMPIDPVPGMERNSFPLPVDPLPDIQLGTSPPLEGMERRQDELSYGLPIQNPAIDPQAKKKVGVL